jgi:hypothetical protein
MNSKVKISPGTEKTINAQGNNLNYFQKPTTLFGFFIDCLSVPGEMIVEYCSELEQD